MTSFHSRALGLLMVLSLFGPAWADEDQAVFAVVSEVPKEKTRIPAKLLLGGAVSDVKLVPGDMVLGNPVWRTLEVCHVLKLEGMKTSDEFTVTGARALDASMLPMALQGYAGDCLIKKAVEIAPLAD